MSEANMKTNAVKDKKEDWLVPMTVRFSKETNDIFQELADTYSISKAQVVRLAAAGSLEKYFGNLVYIDSKQAQDINKKICALGRLMQDMRRQLRRIGINYNQDLKLRHIERMKEKLEEENRNLGCTSEDIDKTYKNRIQIRRFKEEADEIKKDTRLLDKNELNHIIDRYEKATKKVSESLWHIQK